jgi:hypothetical protein
MFIVCNGAFKSGSTWLYLIVKELLQVKGISFNQKIHKEWQSNSNSSFLFSDSTVDQAIDAYSQDKKYFVSKVHLLEKRSYETFAKTDKKVKIIFITRNTGDAIVSHYHHLKTETGYQFPFFLYYWLVGRFKAKEIESFTTNRQCYIPKALNIHFEELKNDFFNQVIKIANYLELEVSSQEIALIKQRTSLGTLKEKAKKGQVKQYSKDNSKASKHFRKGKIGESEEILSFRQKEDLLKIKNNNAGLFLNTCYYLIFKFRRKFYKI